MDLNLRVTASWLCGFGQITSPLCAPAFSTVKWHAGIIGLLGELTEICQGPQHSARHTEGGLVSLVVSLETVRGSCSQHHRCHPSPRPLCPFTLLYFFTAAVLTRSYGILFCLSPLLEHALLAPSQVSSLWHTGGAEEVFDE